MSIITFATTQIPDGPFKLATEKVSDTEVKVHFVKEKLLNKAVNKLWSRYDKGYHMKSEEITQDINSILDQNVGMESIAKIHQLIEQHKGQIKNIEDSDFQEISNHLQRAQTIMGLNCDIQDLKESKVFSQNYFTRLNEIVKILLKDENADIRDNYLNVLKRIIKSHVKEEINHDQARKIGEFISKDFGKNSFTLSNIREIFEEKEKEHFHQENADIFMNSESIDKYYFTALGTAIKTGLDLKENQINGITEKFLKDIDQKLLQDKATLLENLSNLLKFYNEIRKDRRLNGLTSEINKILNEKIILSLKELTNDIDSEIEQQRQKLRQLSDDIETLKQENLALDDDTKEKALAIRANFEQISEQVIKKSRFSEDSNKEVKELINRFKAKDPDRMIEEGVDEDLVRNVQNQIEIYIRKKKRSGTEEALLNDLKKILNISFASKEIKETQKKRAYNLSNQENVKMIYENTHEKLQKMQKDYNEWEYKELKNIFNPGEGINFIRKAIDILPEPNPYRPKKRSRRF